MGQARLGLRGDGQGVRHMEYCLAKLYKFRQSVYAVCVISVQDLPPAAAGGSNLWQSLTAVVFRKY